MRTRNLFRYLLAALALLGNVSFVVAQQQTEITLDPADGGYIYNGGKYITATYGKDMPLAGTDPYGNQNSPVAIPQRHDGIGYTFGGYYEKENGQGKQYYKYENRQIKSATTWDKTVAKATLYAYWIPQTFTVALNSQEGSGGTTSVSATYGQSMPTIQVPTRDGYLFLGYYDSSNYNEWYLEGGNKYYNSDGSSARTWDKNNSTTLYAHWKSNPQGNTEPTNTYTVTLNHDGGTNSISSVKVTPNQDWPSAPAPTKTGYIFEGYFGPTSGTKYYDSNMNTVNQWTFAAGGSIIAHWTPKAYSATSIIILMIQEI